MCGLRRRKVLAYKRYAHIYGTFSGLPVFALHCINSLDCLWAYLARCHIWTMCTGVKKCLKRFRTSPLSSQFSK